MKTRPYGPDGGRVLKQCNCRFFKKIKKTKIKRAGKKGGGEDGGGEMLAFQGPPFTIKPKSVRANGKAQPPGVLKKVKVRRGFKKPWRKKKGVGGINEGQKKGSIALRGDSTTETRSSFRQKKVESLPFGGFSQ